MSQVRELAEEVAAGIGRAADMPFVTSLENRMRDAVVAEKLFEEVNKMLGRLNFGGVVAAISCPTCGGIHLADDADGIIIYREDLDPQRPPRDCYDQTLFAADLTRPMFFAAGSSDGSMNIRAWGDFTKAQMERIEEAAGRYIEQVKGE